MAKPTTNFIDTEIIPYQEIKGAPGQYEKILAKDPQTGAYTRLILSQADLDESIRSYDSPSNKMLIHEDEWEEVYSFSGTLIDTKLNQTFKEGYFACRPPRMKHGPFFHPTSAVSYEVKTPEHLWNKPELEFFDTEVLPWQKVKDIPGQYEKILCKDPDSEGITRLVLNQPDMHACIQDYHNPGNKELFYKDMVVEILILKGVVVAPQINKTYKRGYYGCFAPGEKRGPYFYPTGCTWLETVYAPFNKK
jgi:hypothetical protein